MRVLVVEDDPSVARIVCSALQSAGVLVDCVETAEEARTALASVRYDCALVDLMLPGSSGLYVVNSIRHLPPHLRPEIIVMTGADAASLKSLDRTLVRAVMFKPLHVRAVAEFVRALRQ